jgi:hypothetical protein
LSVGREPEDGGEFARGGRRIRSSKAVDRAGKSKEKIMMLESTKKYRDRVHLGKDCKAKIVRMRGKAK